MKRELIIDGVTYCFFYDKDLNLWRTVANTNLILRHEIDLEIDLNLLKNNLNWEEIKDFIAFIRNTNYKTKNANVTKSKIALHGLFKGVYRDSLSEKIKSNIDFDLSGIAYKNATKSSIGWVYEYELLFFPYNSTDMSMDIGSFAWHAKFRGNVLYGVYCDI